MSTVKLLTTFRFLVKRSETSQRAMVIMIVVSGLSSGLLLGVINHAAEIASDGKVSLMMAALFVAALLIYVISKRKALSSASVAAERAIRDMRISMADQIRNSELLFLEGAGKGDIYARLTQDTGTVSQSVPVVFNGYQSAVVVLATLVYVLFISFDAFLITGVFLALGTWVYTFRQGQSMQDLMQATAKEGEFFDALGHLIDGFKETKLNHAKNEDVFQSLGQVSRQTEKLMSRVAQSYADSLVLSQTFVFLILATLVFILPALHHSQPETVLKLTSAILFMVAPLEVVLMAWHFQMKVDVALSSIERLEALLGRSQDAEDKKTPPDPSRFADFSKMHLQEVVFSYPKKEASFQIGPLDLEFRRGTCTFIVGGNGCGKSTLLKLLTGLYTPQDGAVRIDDHHVSPETIGCYRELFSCIFSDFHLFDRLYGLKDVDSEQVRRLIDWVGLKDRTSYRDGRFTNIDLSTGQRKRLALIVALLEDKPIYVFDEWAADQDPEFRVRFYEEIIPGLTARGKTVIAVTHDDRWFHCCDQLLKLDYGKIAVV